MSILGSFWASGRLCWTLSPDWRDLDSIFNFRSDSELGSLNQSLNLLAPNFLIWNTRMRNATFTMQGTKGIPLYSLCSGFLGGDSLGWAECRPSEGELRHLPVWRELHEVQAKSVRLRQGHHLETKAKKNCLSIAIVFFLLPFPSPIFLSQGGKIELIWIMRRVLKMKMCLQVANKDWGSSSGYCRWEDGRAVS